MVYFLCGVTILFSVTAASLFFRRRLDAGLAAVWLLAGILSVLVLLVPAVPVPFVETEVTLSLFPILIFVFLAAQCLILGVMVSSLGVRLRKLAQLSALDKYDRENGS